MRSASESPYVGCNPPRIAPSPQHRLLVAAILAAILAAMPATAQVSVNPGALDLLPAAPAKKTVPSRRPIPPRTAPEKPTPAATKPPPPVASPNTPAGPAASIPKPTLPTIPPAIAALPPPAPVPAPRPQPVPVIPVAADAPGQATPVAGGVRVTFGPESQTLNPATEAALRDLAARLKPQDTTTITINAYAAGTPDDASTARRLSLARALAARAVLINAGIPSPRIYPRALGATGGDAGQNRVDVMAGPPGPPASIAPPQLPPVTQQPDQKAPAK